MEQVNIYQYLDYREYLRDSFRNLKDKHSNFTYRYFAQKAGIKGYSYPKMVIDGKRNLSIKAIPKFAKGLNLNSNACEFFKNLVLFTQAISHEEKNAHFKAMSQHKMFLNIHSVALEQYEYYSQWYYSAIYALVDLPSFKEDVKWIQSCLNSMVSENDILKAIDLLLKLKLIKRNSNGDLLQIHRSISSGEAIKGFILKTYHREMIHQAQRSIDNVERELRDISALTVNISLDKLSELKKRIKDLRHTLLSISENDDQADAVYQINIQLFPLCKTPKDKQS